MDYSCRFNNSVFKEPVLPRFEKYSILNPCSIFEKFPQPHQKFFQPPRFVVGGFVGSKVCELKNNPTNPVSYSNLLGHIFNIFTSIQEPKVGMNNSMTSQYSPQTSQYRSSVQLNPVEKTSPVEIKDPLAKTNPSVKTNIVAKTNRVAKMNPVAKPDLPIKRTVTESLETATRDSNCNNQNISESSDTSWLTVDSVDNDTSWSPANATKDHKNQTDLHRNPRTVSESSNTSWTSADPMAEDEAKLTIGANSWLTNMFVRADDSESDDSDSDDSGNSDSDSSDSGNSDSDSSDSEWDHSENGHVVDFIRWQGDSLSPISSPTIPQMIGSIPHDYDSIDSDDSDGILISCGNYHFDEEEIDEARQKMLEDVNQKWNEEMKRFCDETDGAPVATKKAKTVQFAPNEQLARTQLMITWGHAYRSARKGDWERVRRDDERFQHRIKSLSSVLNPILDENHRLAAWNRIQSWLNQAAQSHPTDTSSN